MRCTAKGEAVKYLLLLFLITIGINWPELPYNARLADVIFIPLAIAVVSRGAQWTWRWPDTAVFIYLVGALPAILVSRTNADSAMELVRECYLAAVYFIVATAARDGFARTVGTGLALAGAIPADAGLVYFVALRVTGVPPRPLIGEVMVLPYLGDTLRLRALAVTPAMFACVLTAAVPFAITRCGLDRARTWCAWAIVMLVAAVLTFSHVVAGFAVAVLIAAWPSIAAWPRRPGDRRRRAAFSRDEFRGDGVDQVDREWRHRVRGLSRVSIRRRPGTDTNRRRGDHYNVMSYARIKQVAWRTFVEHPVAGIGLDQISHRHDARVRPRGAAVALSRDRSTLDAAGTACGKRRHRRHHITAPLGRLGAHGA